MPILVDLAEQMLRVAQVERQPHQRRHRRQRDVALVPAQPHAQRLLAVDDLVGNHAHVAHPRRIRPRMRPGQREARHLVALGQPAEILRLLFRRSIFLEQFARPERIGHHHGDPRRHRPRRHLAHHLALRLRRKPESAMLLADQHAEEALLLEKGPHLRRQIGAVVPDIPVVDHRADGVDRPIEERLLLGRQRHLANLEQLVPARFAREQFGVPADGARIERFLLGARHAWQDGFDQAVGRPGHQGAPDRRDRQ